MIRLLLIVAALNTAISQLCLKRGVMQLGGLRSLDGVPRFLLGAVTSPWIAASVCLQVTGYIVWVIVVTREKLGIAVAFAGASFYILTAFAAWYFYGETPTPLQSLGIALIVIGVICVSLQMAPG